MMKSLRNYVAHIEGLKLAKKNVKKPVEPRAANSYRTARVSIRKVRVPEEFCF